MVELNTCYVSEVGGRQRNEDACGYWMSDASACWVVSDGAGGHGSGDIASRLVVTTTLSAFTTRPMVTPADALELLQAANAAVIREKTSGKTRDDMHATAAVLLVDRFKEQAVWAHVGDTRIYLFRGGRIIHQTRDHSLVQQMVDAGYGTAAMIRSHPKRSLLTSAIGSAEPLSMSVSQEAIKIQPGDVFLMCTDGWWEYVEEADMEALLGRQPVPEQWLAGMADLIRERAPKGHDNYSAVCVSSDDDRTVMLHKDPPEPM